MSHHDREKVSFVATKVCCRTLFALLIAASQTAVPQSAQPTVPSSGSPQSESPWALAPEAQKLKEAWSLYNLGKISDAEKLFHQIIESSAANKDSQSEAEAHLGLGDIGMRLATFDAARTEFGKALSLFQSAHDSRGVARAHLGLGDVANSLADNKSARNWYGQALAESEALGSEQEKCRVLMRLAAVMDSYADRIKLDNQALDIARKLGNRSLQGQALHWLGQWVFHEGDSETAEQDYKQAEALLDAAEDRKYLGRVFLSEGRLQRAHGALDESIETFRRGLKIAEETSDHEGRIILLNGIAASYGDEKKHREALGMFQTAFELAKETHSPRTMEVERNNIAESYVNLGEPEKAVEMLEEVNRQNPDPFPYAAQFRNATLALAYFRLGEYDRSLAAATRSAEDAKARKNEQFLSEPLMLKAQAEEKTGQNDAALADVGEALKVIEGLRAHLVPSDFLKRGFGEKTQEAFGFSVQLLQELNRPEHAMEIAEQARSRAFLDLLASHEIALRRANERPAVAEASPAHIQPQAASGAQAYPKPGTEVLAERGGKARPGHLVTSSDPELSSGVSAESASLKEMQIQAGRLHSTILSYWVGEEATFVWVLNPGETVHAARIAVKREHLAALVNGVFPAPDNAINQPGTEGKTPWSNAARGGEIDFPARGQALLKADRGQKDGWRELYQLLIDPIKAYLPPAEGSRLTIVPHGPLFALPFSGLRDAHQHYLLEHYALEYSPSISMLKFTGERPAVADNSARHFLLVGDPTGMEKLGLPQLPGSRKEVSDVANRLPASNVTVLIGDNALRERVLSIAPKSVVIHFATHGIVDDGQPFDSFLALSDGKLTARDIYKLDLTADLVFLSACRSGMGRVTGDGVLGLTRAFIYAGTRSVVATVWDVADEPTARLVSSFYENLEHGSDKAQALRNAQLFVLHQLRAGKVKIATAGAPVTLPENPVFWASFVLIGEP